MGANLALNRSQVYIAYAVYEAAYVAYEVCTAYVAHEAYTSADLALNRAQVY